MCFLGLLSLVLVIVKGQQPGAQQKEEHPSLTYQTCTKSNGCVDVDGFIVMDGNWRWLHQQGTWQPNCFDAGKWNPKECPDVETCGKNCAMDGIAAKQYTDTYGVISAEKTCQLNFEMKSGGKISNVGSRVYLMSAEKKYSMFKLINKEFTFDVTVSKLGCGLNGAVYFVEMDEDGGMSKFPSNKAGAQYGTGYCDAQCPSDMKWINGEANLPANVTGENMAGAYGSCCSEMDLWEANKMAAAYTPHPCKGEGRVRCKKATECKGTCDQAGCDFNTYRMGNKSFFGPGSNYTLDSSKPFTIVTQFISSDGTDAGDLSEIKRHYVQNGKVIENALSHIKGVSDFNSLTDSNCASQKTAFGDGNTFKDLGGMKVMGNAMKRGMVLVMSLWDDHAASMLWLDADYPVGGDPTKPGVKRGPCSNDSGKPVDVEKNQADAKVVYANIKFGDIGSTY